MAPCEFTAGIVLDFVRFVLLLLAHEVMQHFSYAHILTLTPGYLKGLGPLRTLSLGVYAILNFSCMYVATYGTSQAIAQLDGFQPVPYPACLAHVYLYSECWRLFDVGFYTYVRK